MKRFFSLILGIVMTILLFTGCEFDFWKPATGTQVKLGYIKDKVYVNESLKLKYTPSDRMIIARDEDNAEESKSNESTSREFYGVILGESPKYGSISIYLSRSNSFESVSEEFLVNAAVKDRKTDKTVFDKYKVGNVEFTKVSNLKDDNLFLLKKVGDGFIKIIIHTYTEEVNNEILSGLSEL